MSKKISVVTAIILLFFINTAGQTQSSDNKAAIDLTNTHCISLNMGMLNQTSTTINLINVNAKMTLIVSLLYNYWTTDELAVEFNIGMLSAEVQQGVSLLGIEQKTAAVFPVQFGLRYYPEKMAFGKNIRPFGTLNFIIATGYNQSNRFLGFKIGSETESKTAFGARFGLGADAFINNWLKLGINAGYILLADFPIEIGTRKNYSGLDISFGFGFLF